MQRQQEPEQEVQTFRWIAAKKISILLIRSAIYVADIYIKQTENSVQPIFVAVFLAFFVVAEAICWYKHLKGDSSQQCSRPFTFFAHLLILSNLVSIATTLQTSQASPKEYYFTIFISLIFNYMLSISNIYNLLKTTVIMNRLHFVKEVEPVGSSFLIIYISLLLGSFLDVLAFAGQSLYLFIGLLGCLICYFLFRFMKSENVKQIKKALATE